MAAYGHAHKSERPAFRARAGRSKSALDTEREVVRNALLHGGHGAESLFQVAAGERAELGRVDEVVGLATCHKLRHLMLEAKLGDQLERLD